MYKRTNNRTTATRSRSDLDSDSNCNDSTFYNETTMATPMDDGDAAQTMATPHGQRRRRADDEGNSYDFRMNSFNYCIACSVWIWKNAKQLR